MRQRLITASVLIAIVLLLLAGRFLYVGILDVGIGVTGIVACFEMSNILTNMGKKNFSYISAFYPAMFYLMLVFTEQFGLQTYWFVLLEVFALVFIYVLCVIVALCKYKNEEHSAWSIAFYSFIPCVYPGLFVSMLFVLNNIELFAGSITKLPWLSMMLILLVMLITILSDTLAFFVGRAFKGPKLAPKISPNKTISGGVGGLIGGIIGSMIVFLVFHFISPLDSILVTLGLKWWFFILVGLFGSMVSQCGDLFESYLKRRADMKDSGNILPGHGGVMDRVDAMMFNTLFISILFLIIL